MEKAIRNTLIIGSSVIVSGVVVYLFVRSAAKKKVLNRGFEESGTTTSPNSGTEDDAAKYNPKADANYLRTMIQGWGAFDDAYPEVRDLFMLLSDDKLIKLNNYYNTKGYKEEGRTLIQELEHEDAKKSQCNFDWCYKNVIKRMKNLGLR
jgi:hypothetical protein